MGEATRRGRVITHVGAMYDVPHRHKRRVHTGTNVILRGGELFRRTNSQAVTEKDRAAYDFVRRDRGWAACLRQCKVQRNWWEDDPIGVQGYAVDEGHGPLFGGQKVGDGLDGGVAKGAGHGIDEWVVPARSAELASGSVAVGCAAAGPSGARHGAVSGWCPP